MAQPLDRRAGHEGLQPIAYPIEHSRFEKRSDKVAIFLPGQDVRKMGMFDELMEQPAGREVLERGNIWLKEHYGYDLLDMAKAIEGENPEETKKRLELLKQARFTVPAVYLFSIAIHNVNKHHNHKEGHNTIPGYVTGISMGMGTAAVVSGFMDFETGLYFHAERGKIMQELSDPQPTSQVTLHADEEKVLALLGREEYQDLDLNIINRDNMWVVGGPDDPSNPDSPMQRLRQEARGLGIKRVTEITTDRSMHGRYVRPGREAFDKLVDRIEFKNPHSVVIGSYTGSRIFSIHDMKEELKGGYDNTIDNRRPVEYLKERRIHIVYEVGNEKGFFAGLLGDHKKELIAGGLILTGAAAVGAFKTAEAWTEDHPKHPNNSNNGNH
ncbi:MAG: ACP S-malonyltransferase [Candidatus Levyibacteriota bacterium]